MEPKGNAISTLRQGVEGSWGISCVLFSYEEGETVAVLREYFRHRRTPVTFFVWQPGLTSGEDRFEVRQGVHRLNNLWTKEAPGR